MKQKSMSTIKPALFLFSLFLVFFLSACGSRTDMDQLGDDNSYHYKNEDLGFQVSLPESFEYYQTQRKEKETGTEDYSEIIFLVPSSDPDFFEDVSGYARPLTVRVHYISIGDSYDDWYLFGEKDRLSYTAKFWEEVPEDWQDIWNEEMKESIKQSLKLK